MYSITLVFTHHKGSGICNSIELHNPVHKAKRKNSLLFIKQPAVTYKSNPLAIRTP